MKILRFVKLLQHVAFNEAMNDVDTPSLNAHLLPGLDPGSPNVLDLPLSVPNLDISAQPFTNLETFVIPFDPALGSIVPMFTVSVVCPPVSIFMPSVIVMLGPMWCHLVACAFSLWLTLRPPLIICLL